MSIPFIDELIAHLDQRFSDIQLKAIKGMSIVPSLVNDSSVTQSSLSELTEFYGELLPNPLTLDVELHFWECKWRSYNADLPDTPQKALQFASGSMYPNIHTLLRVLCTISVTSCECERSVSVLRRLKTYLRSTMGQERLSRLALMHVNYGMELNLEEIINLFASKHGRKMLMSDIFE